MRRLLVATGSLLLALLWPSAGNANGRFPRANQLSIDPGDPSHLVLRATFGLLISEDAGKSFGWVCESGLGFSGDLDPALALFGNGAIAVGYARDLRISHGGCEWPSPFSNGSKEDLIDATLDPRDAGAAVFVSRRQDAAQRAHLLLVTQDSSTPVPLGQSMGDDLSPLTVELAPSDPQRIYVTALAADLTSVLLRSDDRGETWQRLPISPRESLPAFIAAVDPNDADRVYLRLDDSSADYLLVTEDAGATFREAFSFETEMLGFALSPDGRDVALGGPGEGLFMADARDLRFRRLPPPIANLSCLKWTEEALFVCANETADGFTLGVSRDGGQNFSPLFHLGDLAPLSCEPESDVGARCDLAWSALTERLGIEAPKSDATPAEKSSGCGVGGGAGDGALVLLVLLAGASWRRRAAEGARLRRA